MLRILLAAFLSVAVGAVPVLWLGLAVISINGTHATYCPVDSGFWIFACVLTPQAIGTGLAMTFAIAMCLFPLVWAGMWLAGSVRRKTK